MSDKSVEFVTQFIEIYRQNPALWKIKGKCYADRRLKEIGYTELLKLYKTINVKANLDTVKKKINNLRCSFRKEFKKKRNTKKSGTSTEEVYTPSLWYFNLLLFTSDQEQPRQAVGNDSEDEDEDNNEKGESSDSDEVCIYINFYLLFIFYIKFSCHETCPLVIK